LPAPR